MSEAEKNRDGDAPPEAARGRLLSRTIAAIGRWTTASRWRMAIAALCGLSSLAAMFASWSLVAHVAVESLSPTTMTQAFVALDEGRFEEARAIVADLQNQPATPELLSGALFVMGAAKAQEAEEESTAERRRAVHQVAARYLRQAINRSLSPLRRRQALFFLGRSLVGGGEPAEGVAVLEEALADPDQPATEIRSLLVQAFLDAPTPRLRDALTYNQEVLADATLSPAARDEALMRHAEMLIRLNRGAEAREVIGKIDSSGSFEAGRQFLFGRLEFDEAAHLPAESPERTAKFDAAIDRFRDAQRLDGDRGGVSRQAMYWVARGYEELKEDDAALAEYDRLAQLYGEQPEAVAATLSLADARRRAGDFQGAKEDYRVVLNAVGDPLTYANPVLPLAELRRRLTLAHQELVNAQRYADALTLVELLPAVFERRTCMELKAQTFEKWGGWQLASSQGQENTAAHAARREGRYHLRAAGVAFEELARVNYATRRFTDDLWLSVDCYFRGQSFTSAERVLEQYLHEESRKWNPLALLRLGQCRLAKREFKRAITTLEECIELFPRDAVAYQARLECARAYQQSGQFDRAEELLTANLTGDALAPQSQEWRDSLFALGGLLYESQKFEQAIRRLEEAVLRYPEASATLLAKYTIARAFHGAAEAPAAKLREAKTENERQKNRKLLNDYLDGALAAYVEVQRAITLRGQANVDPLSRELLLNCYMMKGSVLYELRRFEESRQAYGNVVTLYENQPIVLESLIQVANCWRRLNQPAKARVTLQRAKLALKRMPPEAKYLVATNFERRQWEYLIDQMSKW